MDICLCDISALEVIRSSGKLLPEFLERPRTSRLDGCVVPSSVELDDLVAGLGLRSTPMHLLVPDGGSTHPRPGVVRHRRAAALPRGSLIRLSRNVLVAGPELALCQLAARGDYDLVDVAQLAFELCGTYLLDQDPNSWKGFVNNDVSATSVRRIEAMTRSLKGTPGAAKLASVLPYVLDASHSPMETVLALLLVLPQRLGGLGLKGAAMNHELAGVNRKIDLAFPASKAGLEYKGKLYHSIEQSERDDRRQNEIIGRGWTILNVWYEDLVDDLLFSRLEEAVLRTFGHRFRPGNAFWGRQKLLRSRLVPDLRCLLQVSVNFVT